MRTFGAAAVLVVAASCGKPFVAGKPKFKELPESSGFTFRHELPNGTLDNSMKSAMGGVALIDYDDDGKIDVFCVNGGWADDPHLVGQGAVMPEKRATSRLYRNLGGMKFEDVTEKAGVAFAGFGLGACVGDFDGDGKTDLFVSAYGMPALYRNKGDGTFEDVAAKAGIAPGFYAGATFLDYDKDGVVDLFASQYVDPSEVASELNFPGNFAGPSVYKPQPARLYRGKGDGTFQDVTVAAHVGTAGKGMGVLATDIDDDGWIDVLVGNDAMVNFAWRNQGDGTFADASGRFGLGLGADGEPRASMGVTAADLDGDGRLDYLLPDTQGGCVYVASGAADKPYFRDRSLDWAFKAATHDQIGWADVAFDAQNDGLVDVWKTHGELRNVGHWDSQWPKLVVNHGRTEKGGMHFEYEPPPAKHEDEGAEAFVTGRGGVAADFDDDGKEDLLLIALNGRARIFHNVTEGAGHWARLKLVGKKSNTSALGARVTALVGRTPVVQEVSGATAYISAPDLRLHFGLGGETKLVEVVVRWPSGKTQRVGALAADKDHVVREE